MWNCVKSHWRIHLKELLVVWSWPATENRCVVFADCHTYQVPSYAVEDEPRTEDVTVNVRECQAGREVESVRTFSSSWLDLVWRPGIILVLMGDRGDGASGRTCCKGFEDSEFESHWTFHFIFPPKIRWKISQSFEANEQLPNPNFLTRSSKELLTKLNYSDAILTIR